jgi:hypothetical protein
MMRAFPLHAKKVSEGKSLRRVHGHEIHLGEFFTPRETTGLESEEDHALDKGYSTEREVDVWCIDSYYTEINTSEKGGTHRKAISRLLCLQEDLHMVSASG